MGKWKAIVAISLAQFVMVLDTTVMNVSLEQVVNDLDTTVANIQLAITFYTLTMAALMLTGGRLGGMWGRLRIYKIGAVVYGVGSLLTALAPNLAVLLIGWSFVEAIGAAMIIPATMALTASNYRGRDRAIAYGILGGIAAAGAAAGPLIGGFVTEYASWRYVFAAETLIMLGLLATAGSIKDSKVTGKESLEIIGLNGGAAKVVTVVATPATGAPLKFEARVRIDTPKERDYFQHGGILQYVLRQIAKAA